MSFTSKHEEESWYIRWLQIQCGSILMFVCEWMFYLNQLRRNIPMCKFSSLSHGDGSILSSDTRSISFWLHGDLHNVWMYQMLTGRRIFEVLSGISFFWLRTIIQSSTFQFTSGACFVRQNSLMRTNIHTKEAKLLL